MHAIQGDLGDQSGTTLNESEWFDFDVAFISMALHHVPDPVAMLRQLRRRLKDGGVLVVIEGTDSGLNQEGDDNTVDKPPKKDDTHEMVEVMGGQKIWPNFSTDSVRADMSAAGFGDVQIQLGPEDFQVPGPAAQGGGWKRVLFAKGISTAGAHAAL